MTFPSLFCQAPIGLLQNLPEFVETGECLLSLNSTLLDNPYEAVGDAFTASVYTKDVGFQESSLCRLSWLEVSRPPNKEGAKWRPLKHHSIEKVTDSSQIG